MLRAGVSRGEWVTWEGASLRTKLAKVMVTVQIAPTHPLAEGKRAKYWMRLKVELPRGRHESFQQLQQTIYIFAEFGWFCSTDHLVDLRAGFDTLWPFDREIQCGPFDHPPTPYRANWEFSHHRAKGISQMADHLVGRHLSPLPRAFRPHVPQAANDFFPIAGLCQGMHGLGLGCYQVRVTPCILAAWNPSPISLPALV
jgi:hypothetical protein